MKSKMNYTIVGVFVIGMCVLLIAGFLWLSVRKHDTNYNSYVVYMHQEVSGLSVQSPVRFNGVSVGFVKSISLDPDNSQLVKILLLIEQSAPISTSTVATLKSQGITGIDYVSLQAETMNAPPLVARPGEQYPVIPSKPSWFMQMSEVLPAITKKIVTLSDNINKVFSEENRINLTNSLQNIQQFSKALNDNTKSLTESMQALHRIMGNTETASKQLPGVVDQLHSTLESIGKTANEFAKAGQSATQTFDAGKTTITNLSNQVMPSAQQALQHLSNAALNLQHLTNELQTNPSVLVRGKQPTLPGPGEGKQ
ncbi:MAG: MCE family protein [Gammaproteobacteria bacterium]|nr:MCE family protein [Gammaproteobacteria bacterium]